MNIPNMKTREKTDLERFLEFADNIKGRHVEVIKEDWDNMCGITLVDVCGVRTEYCTLVFEDNGNLRNIYGANTNEAIRENS